MAHAQQYSFTFSEIAELLAQKAGVTEGHWGILVAFGISAANVGPNDDELKPAAIVPVISIGLQEFEKPTNLTVDASKLKRLGTSKAQKALGPVSSQGGKGKKQP